MGSPKPLLSFRGQTLIARQVGNALPHRPVWLAADGTHYADTDGAVYLADQLPNKQGALSAISPALEQAKQQGFSGIYVLSCDTLLLPEQLIALLDTAKQNHAFYQGISLLKSGGQWLPLLAHWSVAVSGSLKQAVQNRHQRVQMFVQTQVNQTIDLPKEWEKQCHFNTPAEFEQAIQAA